MCGEVKVPEDHLDVCRVCNAFGQNCGVVGSEELALPRNNRITLGSSFVYCTGA